MPLSFLKTWKQTAEFNFYDFHLEHPVSKLYEKAVPEVNFNQENMHISSEILSLVFDLKLEIDCSHEFWFSSPFRFYTGESIWSAQVNITKCRIKSATDDAGRGTPDDRGRGRGRQRGERQPPPDYESCPLQISVAPRRPPDIADPKTRYSGQILCLHFSCLFIKICFDNLENETAIMTELWRLVPWNCILKKIRGISSQ